MYSTGVEWKGGDKEIMGSSRKVGAYVYKQIEFAELTIKYK
jgi:hypothetical protein